MQREISPTSNVVHWQGYVEFNYRPHMNAVVRLFNFMKPGCDVHVEPRMGPQAKAIEYTKKMFTRDTTPGGEWFELGIKAPADIISTQEQVLTAVRAGADFHSILTQFPKYACEHVNNILKLIATVGPQSPDWRDVQTIVFWGDTGTGKTRRARDDAKNRHLDLYKKMCGTKWFDGYRGEKALLLDEFMGDRGQSDAEGIQQMLQWLDGHPLRVESKGATVPAMWTKVYITSNLPPKAWFPRADPKHVEALMRRITAQVYMPKIKSDVKGEGVKPE
jgi:hypothetical protein